MKTAKQQAFHMKALQPTHEGRYVNTYISMEAFARYKVMIELDKRQGLQFAGELLTRAINDEWKKRKK